jgi:hypothetical protein
VEASIWVAAAAEELVLVCRLAVRVRVEVDTQAATEAIVVSKLGFLR